jgi:hypothetical protein
MELFFGKTMKMRQNNAGWREILGLVALVIVPKGTAARKL